MRLPTLADFELGGQTVLVRQDLNVPIQDGQITSDARIRAALPTLRAIRAKGGKLRIMSHLGRPKEGVPIEDQPEVSLAPVAAALAAAAAFAACRFRCWPVVGAWSCGAGRRRSRGLRLARV